MYQRLNKYVVSCIVLCNLMKLKYQWYFKILFFYTMIDIPMLFYTKNRRKYSILIHHASTITLLLCQFYLYPEVEHFVYNVSSIELSSLLLMWYTHLRYKTLKYTFYITWLYQRYYYLPQLLLSTAHYAVSKYGTNGLLHITCPLMIIQALSVYWTIF